MAHAPFAYISQCALRQRTPHGPIEFEVYVNDVNPYSRTTYANDVTFSNFEAGNGGHTLTLLFQLVDGITLGLIERYINGVSVLRRAGVCS